MRDYDPTTGRYIEADPLGLVDGASVYGYVRQNPGRWVVPRGEQVWDNDHPQSLLCLATGYGCITYPDQSTADEPTGCCAPCKIPKGTIGYREDDHAHNTPGVGRHHLNLYQVRQQPYPSCKCFWNKGADGYGYHVNPPPNPEWRGSRCFRSGVSKLAMPYKPLPITRHTEDGRYSILTEDSCKLLRRLTIIVNDLSNRTSF